MSEFVCTRCQFREAGLHGCRDRACNCCFGEDPLLDHADALLGKLDSDVARLQAAIGQADAALAEGSRP